MTAAEPIQAPAPAPAADGLEALLWPAHRRDEALAALARAVGIERGSSPEPLRLAYRDLEPGPGARARRQVPALLRPSPRGESAAASGAPDGLLAIVGYTGPEGSAARVLGPDGTITTQPGPAVARWLRARHEAGARPALARLGERAGVPPERASRVCSALLAAAPGADAVAEGWRLRPLARSLAGALRDAGVARRLAMAGVGYAAQLALLVVAWWMVGARAVAGRSGAGALGAWVAVLGALVAVRLCAGWAAGRLAIDGGEVLRARLMIGLLGLDTEPLRAEGIGQLLGRVMETEAVEALALGGGLLALASVFELSTGVVVLALGAAGARHLALLSVAIGAAFLLAARFWRSFRAWAEQRLALTHDLVERMVGHRTLVAQQPAPLRQREEDAALGAYENAGRALDRDAALLAALVPRGWLLVGLAAIAPALGAGGPGVAALATSLGGVLFVYGALRKLTQALPALMEASIAWRHTAPLFSATSAAASTIVGDAAPSLLGRDAATDPGGALLTARELGFRYPGRADPVLASCSLEIQRGDRILLEGPSGGGKSTLGALLAGLRVPGAGALALQGVSQESLGLAAWRARVGAVPQFHENHVFSTSFLFNLLLGRGWPPRQEDVRLAEALCQELDLGPLLARMPSGLEQLVGDSGWQLSHGERSRLFIARALLQRLEARILDESFAALDPETLERVLACVLRHAETLLVIAHP
jgi:ATP-binding cassette subfamily B protein